MADLFVHPAMPSDNLLQAWIYRESWTFDEAFLLALGYSPVSAEACEVIRNHQSTVEHVKRSATLISSPRDWLWWAEKVGIKYHSDWWLAIMPEGPIGFDGSHFALLRSEMQSKKYLLQERRLIGKWARKPYWTPREAIDISLNFDPFTSNGWRGEAPETGETIEERNDRLIMFDRAFEIGDISEKAPPRDYIQWFDNCGYIVSNAWRHAVGIGRANVGENNEEMEKDNERLRLELVEKSRRIHELEKSAERTFKEIDSNQGGPTNRKKGRALEVNPASSNNKVATANRNSSLQKALLASAVDGFGYDPRDSKSSVPSQISKKSDELGYSITAQTISKHLKECADELVASDTWAKIYPTK